jgi:hypothetical protein
MSNERTRDRGNLFETLQKQKPSQPGFHGDCIIDGTAYEIRGWRRENRLVLSFAPPRGDTNKFPPDVLRGALDPVPVKRGRGAKDAEPEPTPVWSGDIVSDEAAYTVRAFDKQGKTSTYLTLTFERIEKPAQTERLSSRETPELDD